MCECKTTVICLLDKKFPPEHSFVDGMLSNELANEKNINVMLIVSSGKAEQKVYKYNKAVCLPVLKKRSGLSRFKNAVILVPLLNKLIKRKKRAGHRIVLFVRNEPVYLCIASLLSNKVDRLIFQQSFPHECGNTNILKKLLAIKMFKASSKKVDSIMAVSPMGLKRLRNYFGKTKGIYIPLLGHQGERIDEGNPYFNAPVAKPYRFVYIGTHAKSRELGKILGAIKLACSSNIKASFTFIGGRKEDIDRLSSIPGIQELIEKKIIVFRERINRGDLLKELPKYHIGLCLIPPNPTYQESSPTKLAEYMNCGLAVLASKGIPLQEKFITDSNGGILTKWSEKSIADTIIELCSGKININTLRKNALSYSVKNLDYKQYVDEFKDIL
mgnify:CR=1 FL=1